MSDKGKLFFRWAILALLIFVAAALLWRGPLVDVYAPHETKVDVHIWLEPLR